MSREREQGLRPFPKLAVCEREDEREKKTRRRSKQKPPPPPKTTDYLKASQPLAWTIANLVLAKQEFGMGFGQTSETADRLIEWGLDWLLKAHVKASDTPSENVFVGQVSDKVTDHHYFGRAQHHLVKRPVYLVDKDHPGADIAAQYAAAFAAGASYYKKKGDQEKVDMLMKRAKQAMGYAREFKKTWKTPPKVFQAYSTYWPTGYLGHYVWATAWMCKVDRAYCDDAAADFKKAMHVDNIKYALGYDWDAVMPGAAVLMLSNGVEPAATQAKEYLDGYLLAKWQDKESKCPAEPYSTVCYTPKGLAAYSDWGTLRNTANMLFIGAIMAKRGMNSKTRDANLCWTRDQMRYILGSGKSGRSYVLGYGPSPPQRPHHRASACSATYKEPCRLMPSPANGTCCAGEKIGAGCCTYDNFDSSKPAPLVIKGGLVGGPDQADFFPDKRTDYKQSEVALDFNAGFTGALAGLATFEMMSEGELAAKCGKNVDRSGGGKRVEDFTACGGLGDLCPPEFNGKCKDAAWEGYTCNPGLVCRRRNQYFWLCETAVPYTLPEDQIDIKEKKL